MRKYLLLIILVLASFLGTAQTKISGVVADAAGDPIPFANVVFVGSTEGTITNENGRFYLESNDTYTLVRVSFVGYTAKDITLSQRVNYDMQISLEEESDALEEVFIYTGKTSKKDNPAIDILRKIWANKKENGLRQFKQYAYNKYEKLEFDLNLSLIHI